MKKTKIIYYILAILCGVYAFIYGGMDDSPGAQLLGALLFIFGVFNLFKTKKSI